MYMQLSCAAAAIAHIRICAASGVCQLGHLLMCILPMSASLGLYEHMRMQLNKLNLARRLAHIGVLLWACSHAHD